MPFGGGQAFKTFDGFARGLLLPACEWTQWVNVLSAVWAELEEIESLGVGDGLDIVELTDADQADVWLPARAVFVNGLDAGGDVIAVSHAAGGRICGDRLTPFF